MGKMLITLLAGFAEFERNMIAERIRCSEAQESHGEVYNHAPFGYRAEGAALVADPSQQAVVAKMVTQRAQGLSSACGGSLISSMMIGAYQTG